MKKVYQTLFFLLISTKFFSQDTLHIYFDIDKDLPNHVSEIRFENWKKDNPKAEITLIEAFCDSTATQRYNRNLADRRAKTVLKLLKKSTKIEVKAFGEDFQQHDELWKNRKVVVHYMTKSKLSEKVETAKVGENIRIENLNFLNNSDVIVEKSIPVLADLIKIMKENPSLEIEIQGHICCQTIDKDSISFIRAKKVYNELINSGIDPKRLSFKAFGSSKPIFPLPEQNEDERNANRRVEIMIVNK